MNICGIPATLAKAGSVKWEDLIPGWPGQKASHNNQNKKH
jgi:hypothetical protein